MDLIEEHYYSINKICLKILGIWPYNKSRFILLQRILFTVITVTYIILQLSVFITTKFTMNLFVKTMSRTCPGMISVLKYFIFIFKSKTIIDLHHLIQEDWNILRDKLENKILQEHAHNGQIYAILIFSFINVMAVCLCFIQFFPDFLDLILPLDEPRPRRLLITIEYFVFQVNDKYYYITVFHQFIFFGVCAAMMFATTTQLLAFACHAFGIFNIANYRIECSIEYSMHIEKFDKKYAFCKAIKQAVIAHRRAMQFSKIYVSSFDVPYCIMAILGVISLSINLYGFVEAAKISKSMENLIIYFVAIIGHLIYIIVAMYIGQKAIDYNNDLFQLAYSTSWYLLPVPSQKLILFIMQKTCKEFYLTVGLIFIAKMESAAVLVNTALSYVAVMYSCVHE